MPAYPLESHPNGNIIAHQHTFIPCGGKIIPCGNSGNKPGGGKRTCIPWGGQRTCISPLVEIHGVFFLAVTAVTKPNVCFSCCTGNICPKIGVMHIPGIFSFPSHEDTPSSLRINFHTRKALSPSYHEVYCIVRLHIFSCFFSLLSATAVPGIYIYVCYHTVLWALQLVAATV